MVFDPNTVVALNDIAELLSISQELLMMEVTFKKATDIDNGEAKIPAKKALRAIRITAKELLYAVFKTRSGELTSQQLQEVRDACVSKIERAIVHAKILAKSEREAFAGSAAKGNVIQIRVVAPLERLVADWCRHP